MHQSRSHGTRAKTRNEPPVYTGGSFRSVYTSERSNVLSLFALTSLSDVELHSLTLNERLVARTLDGREMNEYVITLLT